MASKIILKNIGGRLALLASMFNHIHKSYWGKIQFENFIFSQMTFREIASLNSTEPSSKGTTKVLKKSIKPVHNETKVPKLYSILMFWSCDGDVHSPPSFRSPLFSLHAVDSTIQGGGTVYVLCQV